MPFTIPEHEKERAVLQKRLKLLALFDQLVQARITPDEVEVLEKDGKFADFAEVLNQFDVCESIRSIYNPNQFGPRPE